MTDIGAVHEKIIRKMIDSYDYITAKELSEMTGLSVSTIKHNIKGVKEELEKYDMRLDSCQGKGFYLAGNDNQRQHLINVLDEHAGQQAESFFFRRNYILETLLEHYKRYTIQMFAEELCVSKNTIQRDLEDIRILIEKYHLDLVIKRNSGVSIEGNEFHLRQLIVTNNNMRYWKSEYDKPPFHLDKRVSTRAYTFFRLSYKQADIMQIQTALQQAEQELDICYEAVSFYRMLEYLAVSQRRMKEGKWLTEHVKANPLPVEPRFKEAAAHILEELLGDTAAELANEELLRLEVQYLAARMWVSKVYKDRFTEDNEDYRDAAIAFAERIGEQAKYPSVAWDDDLVYQLGLAFERYTFRDSYDMRTWNDLDLNMQEQNPGLYAICMANIEDVEENLDIKFKPNDIAWVTLLFHNAIKKKMIKTKAVLVTATDEYTARYQKQKIEDAIDKIEIVNIIHYKRFKKEEYVDMFVISAVRLDMVEDNYIEVSKHVRKDDIQLIAKQVQKSLKSSSNSEQQGIGKILREDLILLDENAAEKEEVIHRGSQLLLEKGYVDEFYEEKVWEREHFRPTYIGKGIAIPHAYKDSVKKNGVVLIRLKHPIEWLPKKKIKIVLMLAVNFETRKELRDFFRDMYELIENDEKISAVNKAVNTSEVLQIFQDRV